MATANALRNGELAQIHIARKDLGLDEDTYRDMLFTVARVRSAKELDWAGRKRVLDHLKARGWKPKAAKSKRPLATDDQSKMIRGLWLELHQAGVVKNSSEGALAAFVKRHASVDALQWLTSAQASKIIEHLKKWRNRTEAAA